MTNSYRVVRTDPNVNSNASEEKLSEEEDDSDLTSCGLGSWRPPWLQVLASPLFFLINFALVGIIQGMTGTYFVASMGTLEKRFAFDSKISGLILIADNFSQMLISPIIGYLGNRFNRPRMIAFGEVILAASCFMSALPYLIYGAGTHLLHDGEMTSEMLKNNSKYELCPAYTTSVDCSAGKHSTVWPAVLILWLGSLMRGLGYTAYFVIGMPHIDDSVSKKNSPLYISAIIALRLIGPAGGFLLSAFSLRFYENPFYDPGITRRDPRFIGAWWIGFTLIGTFLFFAALPMFLFPKQFKNANIKAKDLKDDIKGVKGTISAIKRLATNPIFACHIVGGSIRYIGLGGYFISKTKYIESQYRQTSSGASFITGTTSILPMAIGIILGGLVIAYMKPRPRNLTAYMFLVDLFSCGTIFTGMFLGCPPMNGPDDTIYVNNEFTLNAKCNKNCDCTTSLFTPICSNDRATTFFSPCFAGCRSIDRNTNTLSQCSCIEGYGNGATTGYCESDSENCNNLFIYLLIITMGSLVSSTARTGNYLISLRSVDPNDKSFAMGLASTYMAIFAFIPYPLIFGAITDSACLVWEKTCEKTGNCWFYDQNKFRYYLHGSVFAFMIVGSLFDLAIVFLSSKLNNFYDDSNECEDNSKTDNKNSVLLTRMTANGDSNELNSVDQYFGYDWSSENDISV